MQLLIDPHIIALRLLLALIFGAIVGVEREWRHKTAGIKTNTLVTIGAAAFALMSNTFGPENHNPAQLAAAVVSGIGFIGAGVIIHRGTNVQGVTTAATLWANASMGVALGLGYYELGALTCAAIIVVQFLLRRAVRLVVRRGPAEREIEVRIECAEGALENVRTAWIKFAGENDVVALRQSVSRTGEQFLWRAVFATPKRLLDLASVEESLASDAAVQKIEVRQLSHGDEAY